MHQGALLAAQRKNVYIKHRTGLITEWNMCVRVKRATNTHVILQEIIVNVLCQTVHICTAFYHFESVTYSVCYILKDFFFSLFIFSGEVNISHLDV